MQKSLGENSWVAYTQEEYELKRRVEKQGVQLKDWDIEIDYGLKTGYNEAYIRTETQLKIDIPDWKDYPDVIRPILRGRDIRPWVPEDSKYYLLFIPWHFPLHEDPSITGPSLKAEKRFKEDYPTIYAHLLRHKVRLSKRNKAETGIRYEWYALQRWGASYYKNFDKPKIIFPNMTNSLPFAYDVQRHYITNQKCFIITGSNLNYLSAILNSPLYRFCFKDVYPELLGNTYELSKVFFETVPLKKPDEQI